MENFGDFISQLDKKNIILSPFCGESSCEEKIKKESTRLVLLIVDCQKTFINTILNILVMMAQIQGHRQWEQKVFVYLSSSQPN